MVYVVLCSGLSAFVQDVIDLYVGIIKMLNNGDTLKVDQTHVETVIPAIGAWVCLVCIHCHVHLCD